MVAPITFTDGTFDFVILAWGRSGSHMLASALDGHPDIQCSAEACCPITPYPWLGSKRKKIRGTTVNPFMFANVGAVERVIVLRRHWRDRVRQTTLETPHTLAPVQVQEVPVDVDALKGDQLYRDSLMDQLVPKLSRKLELTYEEITKNRDCRELPALIAEEVLNFLRCAYFPLRPIFYKPVAPERTQSYSV